MELRQLRYFLATAQCMSFSRAAETLFISQSTLSQQIRCLEDEIGEPLFRRTSHSVALTEAGRQILPMVEATCRMADACKQRVQDMQKLVEGTLRIGVTSSCSSLLAAPLRTFIHKYPRVHVQVIQTGTHSITELLMSQQVDMAISITSTHLASNVEAVPLFHDRLCVICSTEHVLAQKKELTLSEVLSYPMVLLDKNLYARRAIDAYATQVGVDLTPRMEVNSSDYLLEIVEHSSFITLQTSMTTLSHPTLCAIPLADCPNTMVASVHYLKESYFKRSAQLLLELLQTSAQQEEIKRSLCKR